MDWLFSILKLHKKLVNYFLLHRGMYMLTKQVKQQLLSIVGPENYDDSKVECLVYSYDATPGYQSMPDAVIKPGCTNEVAAIVKVCNEHKVPIIPRGSGTNLSGGTCPTE